LKWSDTYCRRSKAGRWGATAACHTCACRKVGGDGSVSYLRLPAMLPGEEGSRDHPGYPAHQRAADSVAECLTELWK